MNTDIMALIGEWYRSPKLVHCASPSRDSIVVSRESPVLIPEISQFSPFDLLGTSPAVRHLGSVLSEAQVGVAIVVTNPILDFTTTDVYEVPSVCEFVHTNVCRWFPGAIRCPALCEWHSTGQYVIAIKIDMAIRVKVYLANRGIHSLPNGRRCC